IIKLVVEPQRTSGVFDLLQLSWGNMAGEPIDNYQLNDGLMEIELIDPLVPTQTVEIFIVYILSIPRQGGAFGYTERQINLTNWYPFIPPYSNERGWVIQPPAIVGEHLVFDSADFIVEIFSDLSEIIIAGPAPEVVIGNLHRYTLQGARAFSWSASKDFLALGTAQDNIPVTVYVFPEHQSAGQAVLRTAVQALETFEELFGAYPYPSLSVVEIDYEDGLESDGLFFIGEVFFAAYDGSLQNLLPLLTAHETAHQWWYGQVGNNQALEPWLDEALATYSEFLFYENLSPALGAWWWEIRVEQSALFELVGSRMYDYFNFSAYVRGEYAGGAIFMQALRDTMGDEVFFSALRDYKEAGTNKILMGQDFLQIMQSHTELDLNLVIEEHFTQ
ncbi:MAG: M1 family aminopeptidase, partial [Chloroflexota bacterium]